MLLWWLFSGEMLKSAVLYVCTCIFKRNVFLKETRNVLLKRATLYSKRDYWLSLFFN